jgi:histidinol dehydrogenase
VKADWIEVGGDPAAAAARVRALVPDAASVSEAVAEILAGVRERGDAAVAEYEARFGSTSGVAQASALQAERAGALGGTSAALGLELRAALEVAIRNVEAVAAAGLGAETDVVLNEGHRVRLREIPVHRAAVYAPGGRNPFPSSVVMGAVTARAAGVEEVVVCASHPVMRAAAELCGADEILPLTGAQAIGALAYGTESIRPVDVIVGPGNLYVQEAKRQVSGVVGIDGFAGPSDLVVLASDGADPVWVALDLLAQAEHGDDSLVVCVSDSEDFLDDVGVELGSRLRDRPTVAGARCVLAPAASAEEALAFAEALAPEHLQLVGEKAEALASQVRRAGCLFVGRFGASAFGDYVAGSNHTLPTGGAARFASGLGVRHFRRRMSEVRITAEAAGALAPHGMAIAEAEGFAVHAESMGVRQDDGHA